MAGGGILTQCPNYRATPNTQETELKIQVNLDLLSHNLNNLTLTPSLFDLFKGKNISSFWAWMRGKLFPALYDTRWYNGWMFDYDEGFMGNRELFMVGMPRLRQIRIKPGRV